MILPIYSIFQFGVPWATTQYYGYQATQHYNQNSLLNLGLIFNKAMFFNIFLAVFFTLCFYTIVPFALSNFIDNQKSIEYLYSISRSLGISIIFQYWEFVLVIYFMSIEYYYHLPFLEVIGLIVQLVFQPCNWNRNFICSRNNCFSYC